jgi:hypothetical protein
VWAGGQLELRAALGHGQQPLAPLLKATVRGDAGNAAQARVMGEAVAAELRAMGGNAYLDALPAAPA